MNIGFDIDGVLTDFHGFLLRNGERFLGRNPANRGGFGLRAIFGCTAGEERRFWLRFFLSYCLAEPPRENAAALLRALRKRGHRIFLITSRVFCARRNPLGTLSRLLLKAWLRRYGIPWDGLFFCREDETPEEKRRWCRKLCVDVMFEDTPENLARLPEGTVGVCFSAPYNRGSLPGMIRLDRFPERPEALPAQLNLTAGGSGNQ